MKGGAGPYKKGVRKEQELCRKLRSEGWDIAQRTAGSKSPFDIIAIQRSTGEIILIQCKSDKMPDSQKERIEKEHSWLTCDWSVRFEVV